MRLVDHVRQNQRSAFPVIWVVFFFQGMALGSWLPALTNMFASLGLSAWVPMAFMIPPLCAMISPVIGGALADQKVAADRLYAWASLVSALLLALSFWCLDVGLHPLWFMAVLLVNALVSAPTWGLLSTVSLRHLDPPEQRFPLVRVGATIGWIVGGLVVSYGLRADASPVAGYAAAVWRLLSALVAFGLPHTPPLGVVRDWRSRLGLDAFSLLKQRDHMVFFLVTGLYSIPISAFYMYGPEFLAVLGDRHPAGTMTVAQVLEIVSMLVLGSLLARHSVKAVLLWALGLSVLRFGMSAQAGVDGQLWWHIGGLALHGVCYTLYFITAQIFLDRRVEVGLKGQAQGLLMMVAGGVGPLLGSWFCGWLRERVVSDAGDGWPLYWGILSGMIAFCTVIFALLYKGLGRPQRARP